MNRIPDRRKILRALAGALTGAALPWGCGTGASAPVAELDRWEEFAALPHNSPDATHAIALSALARAAAAGRGQNAGSAWNFPAITRFTGFLTDDAGDVVLFGTTAPGAPRIEVDSFVAALRNAYRVSPEYHGVPGCTIDPQPGEDPWAIQKVQVFGMPFDCSVANRQVALDYELKKIGAGVVREPGIRSAFDSGSESLCGETRNLARNTVHRYWFYPRIPPKPRFERDERIMRILAPTGVQLLTEQEFLDRQGNRTGAAEATDEALQFAKEVSAVLAAEQVTRYATLVADFRMVELAKLIRFEQVPEEKLQYFLEGHTLRQYETPRYVGGIIRTEFGQVVCNAPVKQKPGAIECLRDTTTYRREYRGGVEARIEVAREDFESRPSEGLLVLRHKILAQRVQGAVSWSV